MEHKSDTEPILSNEDFYGILGCGSSATVEQLNTEYRLRALQCHPDKNSDDPAALAKFQCLQEAKEVLCDSVKRKEYDRWRSSGLGITWKQWNNRRGTTVWHWTVSKTEGRMLDRPDAESVKSDSEWNRWTRHSGGDLIRKFRNYEI